MKKPKNKKPIFGEWQLCPKCLGSKKMPTISSSSPFTICDICNGIGIIVKPIINQ